MTNRPFSGRQYQMLQALYDNGVEGGMPIEDAQRFDQRPLRSMLIRGWATYRSNGVRGFHITKEGKEAMENFHTVEILRRNPKGPITSYFDPTAFGITPPRKKEKGARAPRGPAPNVREYLKRSATA